MPEMILYISLTSVLMVTLMNSMLIILEHDKITTDREYVQQEVRVAIDQILFDLREAESVDTDNSILDDDNGILVLNIADTARDPTEITLSNGSIVRRRGAGAWQQLTGDNIKVTSLRFEKKVPSENPSIISVAVGASELYSSESPLEVLPIVLQDSATIRKQYGKVDPRDFNGSSYSSINPYFDISSSSVSVPSTCGNGVIDEGEECDDGNTDNGDTCSSDCQRETVTVDINFCPATAACDNHPGPVGGSCPPGPLNCTVPNNDWDCNWQCPDDPLEQGIYDRCIYAYQCACEKGGGSDTDVTSYINCYDNRRSMFPSENPSESYTQCSSLCDPAPLCGNGILDDGEECDGGGVTASCDADCTVPECGDNVWNSLAGEQCDDGNEISEDGCFQCEIEGYCCTYGAYTCLADIGSNCIGADKSFHSEEEYSCTYECHEFCGNGYLDTGEECDDGNWDEWDGCSYDCTLEYCCDTVTHACTQGVSGCGEWDIYPDSNSCDNTCAVCGDSVTSGNEECDDGTSNSDSTPDACRTSCINAYCGDSIQDTGETCDEGGNTVNCDNDCTVPDCGDGITNIAAGEECDDGNEISGDGCYSCQYEGYCCELGLYTCTDGISGDCTGPTKEFYAGGSYYCNSYCHAWCGNGFVDVGEECDDGNWDDWDTCSSSCELSVYCCDEYMGGGCWGPVSPDYCSSSYVDEATCNANCSVCGNGVPETGEECDDGNTDNSDSCTNLCKKSKCGDGYIQDGEECELPGTDTCSANCISLVAEESLSSSSEEIVIPPNCGNRIIEEDEGEECDDGALNGTGECSEYCTNLFCGDGILSSEIFEECEPVPFEVVNGVPYYNEPICGESCSIPDVDSKTGVITGGCKRLFLTPCDVSSSSSGFSDSFSDSSQSEIMHSAANEQPIEEFCGNTITEDTEECDNGGICDGGDLDGQNLLNTTNVLDCINGGGEVFTISDDGCTSLCKLEICGDGIIQANGQDGIVNTSDDEICDNGSICSNNTEVSCASDLDCTFETLCEDVGDGTRSCGGGTGSTLCRSDDDCELSGLCLYDEEINNEC
ncbi:MAG: DUF4215 domain-containing protein, partial [Candidatus Peribacteraceae bacterium]|nr:DUF4215 domain-containing protein [Candidatus Peribacteraceae bacterium]